MDATPPEAPGKPIHRRLLWLAFWFVFFTTPIFAFVIPLGIRGTAFPRILSIETMVVGSLIAGIFTAAFILARLTTKTLGSLVLRTFIYGVGIFAVYLFFAYAGCVAISN